MNGEWSLDEMYAGAKDPALIKDIDNLPNLIQKLAEFADSADNSIEVIENSILALEDLTAAEMKLFNFLALKHEANTADPEITSLLGKVEQIDSNSVVPKTKLNKKIASLENLDEMIEKSSLLKEYDFMLHETVNQKKYMLSDDVEDAIAKMNLSAGSSWSSLMSYLTSNVKANYRGEEITLSEVRNLAYDEDSQVRKDAYDAEIAAYPAIADSVAFSLNNIKSQVNTVSAMRGYKDPLDETLIKSRMKKETLDALWQAVEESLPKFWSYLQRKGELLGYENGLPWYDLFAPIGEGDGKVYTVEDAEKYLTDHFVRFAPDMAEMMHTAFRDEWIDFYPRKGKVGGAFCANLPLLKQSRILTNFTGVFGDIVTLAHELGHAYHGMMIENNRILNTDYTMPVAETASTFNETVIMNTAIDDAQGAKKLRLLESQLQDTTQVICDIYSRYLFEKEVFDRRKDEFLFPDQLNDIMLRAQEKAYGTGLDPQIKHPYMWACKSHYYSEGLSFYNFPYAFGCLFARGLYAQYLKDGEAFLPKYQALLKATTSSMTEDVAAYADIDLTNPEFWREGLKTITDSIDLFMEMTSK